MDASPGNIGSLAPGTVIEFSDITEISAFEDVVAAEVDTTMSTSQARAWAGRIMLRDLIRPPKFNGRIGDIRLVTMADPYERLRDARERGVAFGLKGGTPTAKDTRSVEFRDEQIPLYRGFQFVANATSTGRGLIGQIKAELWYFPVPKVSHRGGEREQVYKYTGSSGGASINRVVSKPVITSEAAFTDLGENSRRIAYSILSANLRHPLPQPFHN